MGILSSEIQNLKNPVLGAYLLFRFSKKFVDLSNTENGIKLPLLYIPLPLIFDNNFSYLIQKTNLGWYKFLTKFPYEGKASSSISESVFSNLNLSQKAISVGIKIKLFDITPEEGEILPNSKNIISENKLNTDVIRMAQQADKLGKWCADYSIQENFSILGLRL